MTDAADRGRPPPRLRKRLDVRSLVIQSALTLAIVILGWIAVDNFAANMRARNIPTSFDFLSATAGFDLNQSLIEYSATSTYARAFLVGLLNTLSVAAIGVVFATIIGFVVGVARLSQNWLVAKLAAVYVETIRNTPLLLQLFFWYTAVLAPLPGPRQSLALPTLNWRAPDMVALFEGLIAAALAYAAIRFARSRMKGDVIGSFGYALGALFTILALTLFAFGPRALSLGASVGLFELSSGGYAFLNNRGLFVPMPSFGGHGAALLAVLVAGVAAALVFRAFARKAQQRTGAALPVGWISLAIAFGPALLFFAAAGGFGSIDYPVLRGFNFNGGARIYPEAFALVLGLTLYTAAFIAEIVRAGVQSVSRGQGEAAAALGLRRGQALKLVIVPQALRVIIPPLTNQYLNLTKNSSLAVFIGFPDLVQVFVGTVLNQTGAMVQIISITMGVYLVISLATSYAMNVYNSRMALAER